MRPRRLERAKQTSALLWFEKCIRKEKTEENQVYFLNGSYLFIVNILLLERKWHYNLLRFLSSFFFFKEFSIHSYKHLVFIMMFFWAHRHGTETHTPAFERSLIRSEIAWNSNRCFSIFLFELNYLLKQLCN